MLFRNLSCVERKSYNENSLQSLGFRKEEKDYKAESIIKKQQL